MTPRNVTRIALAYLGLVSLQLGLWALLAPRSFFDDFPGFGRAWVAVDGPYNEHLVRDVGALNLALVVLLAAAAVRGSRELTIVAGVASLAWGLPHFIYHLFNREGLATGDQLLSLGGLAAFVCFAALIIGAGRKLSIAGHDASS